MYALPAGRHVFMSHDVTCLNDVYATLPWLVGHGGAPNPMVESTVSQHGEFDFNIHISLENAHMFHGEYATLRDVYICVCVYIYTATYGCITPFGRL